MSLEIATSQSGCSKAKPTAHTGFGIDAINLIYSGYFKIPEAAVNLQRRALCKRNNVRRLFRGEAYRLTGYGIP
ncbi:MAG: hypothetical protein LBJ00_13655 [Planctomycetaceae bacterium]|nr:hypothetical protein [Planctomycetaceae bacterium]